MSKTDNNGPTSSLVGLFRDQAEGYDIDINKSLAIDADHFISSPTADKKKFAK